MQQPPSQLDHSAALVSCCDRQLLKIPDPAQPPLDPALVERPLPEGVQQQTSIAGKIEMLVECQAELLMFFDAVEESGGKEVGFPAFTKIGKGAD